MKNLFKHLKEEILKHKITAKIIAAAAASSCVITTILGSKAAIVKDTLSNRSGESYIDTAVKILIAVVLGALLLAGLYALFGNTVLPTLVQRITDMFNYGGA
jgi:hypothetical protein